MARLHGSRHSQKRSRRDFNNQRRRKWNDERQRHPEPERGRNHPLRPYSVLGRADELKAKATETIPLLGDFIMSGQATMLYAAPNTGKTLMILHLLLEAIECGRIEADLVY